MQPYTNRSGNSGVVAFEIGKDHIDVVFLNGTAYRYDLARPGAHRLRHMQALARAGKGLSGSIVRESREDFAAKLK